MIELKNVQKYYNSNGVVTVALKDINLSFSKNEIVAITGESGSGKSTLLNVISGMDRYDDGEIYFKGNETSYFDGDDLDEFRKSHVGFIFQNYNIIDSYTVLQNVMFPLLVKGLKQEEAKTKALELIERVGLSERIHNRGTKLSGGEKQRVVIARALASDCEILACDEPTGNLDSKTAKEIINLIQEVAQDKLVLIVTHNYNEIKDVATRHVALSDGRVILDEANQTVLASPSKEVLNLDYKPIPNKTIALLTKFNIFSTPRKTILLSLVFLAISLIVYTMYQSVYKNVNDASFTYGYSYYNVYDDNYFVVNKKDWSSFELPPNIEGDVRVNPFSESIDLYLKNPTNYSMQVKNVNFDLKHYNFKGEYPQADNEAYLVVPKDYYIYSDLRQTYDLFYTNSNHEIVENIKVTGYGFSDYIALPTLVTKQDYTRVILFNALKNMLSIKSNLRVDIELSITENDYTKVKVPEGIDLNTFDLTFSFKDTYVFDLDYELSTSAINYIYIELGLGDILDLPCYEARIYTDDVKSAMKAFDDSFNIIYPATESKMSGINQALLILYCVMLIVPMILLYLVTFVILLRIYESKVKEYTIMRTLGIARQDMKKLMILETISLTLMTSIIAYVALTIIGFATKHPIFSIYTKINFFTTIVYFVVMFVFSFFIGLKFAKRLFSKTVIQTLKED